MNTQNQNQDQIDQFINSLLEQTGLFQNSGSSQNEQEIKKAYISRLRGFLEERIGLAYMVNLQKKDPKLNDALEKLTEQGDQNKIINFLQQELPQFAEIGNQAMVEFGKQFIHDIQSSKQNPLMKNN